MTERHARPADIDGGLDRDGVHLAYRVYGEGEPTVVLMPTWSLVPSRLWKAQVPYLARHFRVVTFDGRGSGGSDAPIGAAAYADSEYVADTRAVLEATGTTRCVLVTVSRGAPWALKLALDEPDRVLGVVAIGPATRLVEAHEERTRQRWGARHDRTDGWATFNRYYWVSGGYEDFLRFWWAQLYPEPHSSKQIEDGIGWGLEIAPERLVDTEEARLAPEDPEFERRLPGLRCPVLVVHGDQDRVRPPDEAATLAALTGGSLVTVAGGGHGPHGRDPVKLNHLVREFVDTVAPRPTRRTWTRALNRPKRALYLSSPIGLGHAKRDVAIAAELRRHHPGLQIDWLAQHPVTAVLADAGERVHPASAWLLNESAHVEFESAEHDLHAFQAVRRMDEILVANFMTFADVVEDEHYDLVIGDEAWDVDHFLHENPELKRFAFAWMTDFVGWLPMPDGGAPEAALAADHNAEMIAQRARYRRLRDRSIFIGDPEDIVDDTFGPGLPGIREWTEQNFDFAGYVTGFDPAALADRDALRDRLGHPRDLPLCVVTVGGSGVGSALLRRVLDAVPAARRRVPGLRFVVVTGPRIDPASLPPTRGVDVHGYLPDLYQHLAAADLAVVQGGLTTCMELTAHNVPFIAVPLRHHFEQHFHVRARLERYEAGRYMTYEEATDPDALAAAIAEEVGRKVAYRPVEPGGAARAASMLAELL
jgi:pimeloyl-ACP methyl ester carboxylesterase/predicted glycosyltransferase